MNINKGIKKSYKNWGCAEVRALFVRKSGENSGILWANGDLPPVSNTCRYPAETYKDPEKEVSNTYRIPETS